MSFILDALNKKEQQSHQGEVPGLDAQHHSAAQPRSSRTLLTVVMFVLVLLTALLSTLLYLQTFTNKSDGANVSGSDNVSRGDQSGVSEEMVVSPHLAEQRPIPLAGAANEPTPVLVAEQLPISEPDYTTGYELTVLELPSQKVAGPEVAALYGRSQLATTPKSGTKSTHERRIHENENPVDGAQQQKNSVDEALARALWDASRQEQDAQLPTVDYVTPGGAKPITVKPDPVTPVSSKPDIEAPLEDTLAAFEAVPYLHQLSENTQTTVPSLMYTEHQYPGQYVVINRQTLLVGESTQGVKVDSILTDGVVLDFQGQRFKLRALSSWVNHP